MNAIDAMEISYHSATTYFLAVVEKNTLFRRTIHCQTSCSGMATKKKGYAELPLHGTATHILPSSASIAYGPSSKDYPPIVSWALDRPRSNLLPARLRQTRKGNQ